MNKHLVTMFRDAFRHHPKGVAVVAAAPEGRPVALTISSLISASATPPVVAFSLSGESAAAAQLQQARTMVIHLLRHADIELARLGATSGADRFSGEIPWAWLPTGEPRYTGVATWFRAHKLNELALPGATLIAAELVEGEIGPPPEGPEDAPLIYLGRRWLRLDTSA